VGSADPGATTEKEKVVEAVEVEEDG